VRLVKQCHAVAGGSRDHHGAAEHPHGRKNGDLHSCQHRQAEGDPRAAHPTLIAARIQNQAQAEEAEGEEDDLWEALEEEAEEDDEDKEGEASDA